MILGGICKILGDDKNTDRLKIKSIEMLITLAKIRRLLTKDRN